jgi:hypothetical protein
VSPTSGSKKKDPVVAATDDAQPETPVNGSSNGLSNGRKVSASTAKRDEVVVDVPTPADSKESADSQGDTPKPSVVSSASSVSSAPSVSSGSNDTVTDLKTEDVKAKVESVKPEPSEPKAVTSDWSTPSEPGGSVFAGRTDATPARPAFGAREMVGIAPAEAPAPSGGGFLGGGPQAEHLTPDAAKNAKPGLGGRSPRKAHLQVSRFEPWSVMKFSFVMSLVCFVVLMVAVVVLYMILSGLGVFDAISSTINELTQEQGATKTSGFDAASWFSFTRIFAYTALVGALNVLLITALATVWSVIYNIAADFVGGVEVTLKEAE